MKNPVNFIKSLNWTKDDLKKFIFCACLIVFAAIVFHVFPIKVVIDTNAMWPKRLLQLYEKPLPLRVDIADSVAIVNDFRLPFKIKIERDNILP